MFEFPATAAIQFDTRVHPGIIVEIYLDLKKKIILIDLEVLIEIGLKPTR